MKWMPKMLGRDYSAQLRSTGSRVPSRAGPSAGRRARPVTHSFGPGPRVSKDLDNLWEIWFILFISGIHTCLSLSFLEIPSVLGCACE